MAVEGRIEVHGLKELDKAFKQVESDLPGELKVAFKAIAEHVVGVAQQKMPHKTGTAQRSIKARSTSKSASIAFGGSAAPYFPWLDFGGHHQGKKNRKEREGGFIKQGRYVYPAIAESGHETTAAVNAAVESVSEAAGFETKEG